MDRPQSIAGRNDNGRDDPFLERLRVLTHLSGADLDELTGLLGEPRPVRARGELVREGHRADQLHVLRDGWACRCHLFPDGRRQITSLLLPGDLCDLDAFFAGEHLATIATLTPCTVVPLPFAELHALATRRPEIVMAFGRLLAADKAVMAERIACLGRRSAGEQVAHLLCELLVRLTAIGRASANGFMLPITQEEIGDVLGLTAVHVNRVLNRLRADGLIERTGHALTLRKPGHLRQIGQFRPDYLRLDGLDGARSRRSGAGREGRRLAG